MLIFLKFKPDNKSKVAKIMKIFLVKVENIVGHMENAGYQHFLHVPQCFQKDAYSM